MSTVYVFEGRTTSVPLLPDMTAWSPRTSYEGPLTRAMERMERILSEHYHANREDTPDRMLFVEIGNGDPKVVECLVEPVGVKLVPTRP